MTIIHTLTPKQIVKERNRLLKKANVNTVKELQQKVNTFQASTEQHGILLRLRGLAWISNETWDEPACNCKGEK